MCRFSYYYHHFCLYFFNSYFFFLSFFHEWVRKNRLLCCFWSYLSVRCRRNCVFLIRFNITVFPFDIWSGSENTDLDIYMKISKNWRIHFLPRPYLGNSLTHFRFQTPVYRWGYKTGHFETDALGHPKKRNIPKNFQATIFTSLPKVIFHN